MEFVLGRLIRLGDLADLLTDLGESLADLLVGLRLDLGFETVRLVNDWLEASDLTVVGVDETGKNSHSR